MSAIARELRWLHHEQTLNERIDRDQSGVQRIRLESDSVQTRYRPENQQRWRQPVIWLPERRVRAYGPVREELARAFGGEARAGRLPMLVHPQMPAAHRRLRDACGIAELPGVWCTPTSSFRSVFARGERRAPVVLKLSMGAKIGGRRRALSEAEIAGSLIISRLLETIPLAERKAAGFDWFPETAGIVETSGGTGWLLRRLPRLMSERSAGDLVPAFSLISRRGERAPMLVEMIREAEMSAEAFVLERIITPYVRVLAWLLFEQGIQAEAHPQNVHFEMGADSILTGRVVLRDLSDMSVSIPLRVANGKPLPELDRRFFPRATPFSLSSVAADHCGNDGRKWMNRGWDTAVKWGLRAFVWSINTSLARFFPRYRAVVVEREYLALWQRHARETLRVTPPRRPRPRHLAVDWAIAVYLANRDWGPVTSSPAAALPACAESLRLNGDFRRRAGRVYQRVECGWGSLYLEENLPAYFSPSSAAPSPSRGWFQTAPAPRGATCAR